MATSSKTKPYYRPELDALRFFAFLVVFAHHAMGYVADHPGRHPWILTVGMAGAFGVPVFFLLSAFLITELLVREIAVTGRVHILKFYVRRILRIWPLYFTVFYAGLVLNHFAPGVGTGNPCVILAYTGFLANWYTTLRGWHAGAMDPLWSISVEEQFYFFVPVLAALGGRRLLARSAAVLLLVSFVTVFLYGYFRSPGDHGEWTNSLVQFQFFSAGTLMALYLKGRVPGWSAPVRAALGLLGALCWVIAVAGFHVRSWDPQPTAGGAVAGWLLVLSGAVLLFSAALGIDSHRVPGWLAYCGRISYGLYLFHSPLLFLVLMTGREPLQRASQWISLSQGEGRCFAAGVVLLLSLLLAHLSYRYFEMWFLRWKRRFTLVPSRD